MPKIIIESVSGGCNLEVPNGGSLADVCDSHNAPIPFSCRGASCGTCRIDVFEGMDFFESPKDEELDILDIFGDDPHRRRLACQAKMKVGGGVIRIRAVDDA